MGNKAGVPMLVGMFLFGVAIAGVGGFLLYQQNEETTTYETTDATVTSSEVVYSTGAYHPIVTYEYQVDGDSY